jgi:hypothetical protein
MGLSHAEQSPTLTQPLNFLTHMSIRLNSHPLTTESDVLLLIPCQSLVELLN